MRCEEFEARLNEVLDERRALSSAAEIEGHARQCGGCRELLRLYEAMLAGLTVDKVPAVPAGLTARIVSEAAPSMLRPGRDNVKILPFPRLVSAMSLAAAVLLFAAGWLWLNRGGEPAFKKGQAGGADVAQADHLRQTHRPEQAKSNPVSANPGPIAANARSDKHERAALPEAEWAQPGTEWAQEVANGLQPVTRPTVGAINGFLNLWGIGDRGIRDRGVGDQGRRS
ncbi:MAG TPA: hypothetical protein VFI31_01095 [Pirellulales bacterium]|nr:hypothetical protein [Pirellulales bacterium]